MQYLSIIGFQKLESSGFCLRQHLSSISRAFTAHYLKTIYILSTNYLHSIYTLSTHYQLITSCTLSTHYLHTMYRHSTHHLHTIYTLSTDLAHEPALVDHICPKEQRVGLCVTGLDLLQRAQTRHLKKYIFKNNFM